MELAIMLQYGENTLLPYRGAIDFPGVSDNQGLFQLTMPENSVFFTTLLASSYAESSGFEHGYWHASIFDALSGERIGEVCSIRFELGEGGEK